MNNVYEKVETEEVYLGLSQGEIISNYILEKLISFDPDSKIRIVWDFIALVALITSCFYIPVSLSFRIDGLIFIKLNITLILLNQKILNFYLIIVGNHLFSL